QSIDQIQSALRYGINAYKSVKDACPGAVTGEGEGWYPLEKPEEPKIILVAIAEGAIQNERVTLFTKGHECLDMKLRCRENLSLSVEPSYLYLFKPLKDDEVGDLALIKCSPSANGQEQVCEGLILRYKPKVISRGKEPVKIMTADGKFVDCPGVVFDTGNTAGTGISAALVKALNLDDKIDVGDRRSFEGVGRDNNGNPITGECNTIMINVKIRNMWLTGKALYGMPPENIHLLIGTDIIDLLGQKDFKLGK
ncbi:hypothetical protein P5673_027982, partial [Acropora cervicornis]